MLFARLQYIYYLSHVLHMCLASYPGHVGGGKSDLVSTVCTCANDSGNTSPIMDTLHVVAMRRNNQPRYTAFSVAAVFTGRWLPLSETQGVTRQGLCYNHRQFHRHCACSWKQTAESHSRYIDLTNPIFTIVDTFDRIQLLCFQHEISLSNTTKSELERFIKVFAFTCHVRGISSRRTCFGAIR